MAEAWIRLLGIPEILRSEGMQVQPRGRKTWALLAYLILGRRKASRSSLASLPFAEADDPLGALGWSPARYLIVFSRTVMTCFSGAEEGWSDGFSGHGS